MKTRIISGLCMVPLLAIVYFGGYWLIGAAFVIGAIGLHEFYKGFENMGIKPCYFIGYGSLIALYLPFIPSIFPFYFDNNEYIVCWAIASSIASMLYLFNVEERKVEDALATMAGIFYVVFFSYHIALMHEMVFVWIVLIASFATDIFAYFSGYLFGNKKLCPKLSPKKTWAGAIGGTLGSIICCGLFGYFVIPFTLKKCLIMGLIGAIFAQLGDLTASAFKRKMGIKDYGNLIPGHGGIMDRFDSVLMVAPIIYYFVRFFV